MSKFLSTLSGPFSAVRRSWTLRKKLETRPAWNVRFRGFSVILGGLRWVWLSRQTGLADWWKNSKKIFFRISLFCDCCLPQMELWAGTLNEVRYCMVLKRSFLMFSVILGGVLGLIIWPYWIGRLQSWHCSRVFIREQYCSKFSIFAISKRCVYFHVTKTASLWNKRWWTSPKYL